MRKKIIAGLLAAAILALALLVSACATTYTITFPTTQEGYVIEPRAGQGNSVKAGEHYKFAVSLLDGYKLSVPLVRVNGEVILPDESNTYIIPEVNTNITITVENIVSNNQFYANNLKQQYWFIFLYTPKVLYEMASSISLLTVQSNINAFLNSCEKLPEEVKALLAAEQEQMRTISSQLQSIQDIHVLVNAFNVKARELVGTANATNGKITTQNLDELTKAVEDFEVNLKNLSTTAKRIFQEATGKTMDEMVYEWRQIILMLLIVKG